MNLNPTTWHMPSLLSEEAPPGTSDWWKKHKSKAEFVVGEGWRVPGFEDYYDDEGRPNGMTENPAGFVADRHEGSVAIQEALLTASVDARKRGVFVEPAEGEWPGDAP